METNNYKITGEKCGLTATKCFDNDCVEVFLKFTFGKWENDAGSVEIEIEIIRSEFNSFDSHHSIILTEKMKDELTEQVWEFVNDDLERFGYDYHDDDNYIAHDYATTINYKGNE